jgi:hypothetical protein
MPQTFHEMLNTVSFRNMAGKVDGHEDLWALRDLLLERQLSVQLLGVRLSLWLTVDCPIEVIESMNENIVWISERLETDIMIIEQYCKKRGIIRSRA